MSAAKDHKTAAWADTVDPTRCIPATPTEYASRTGIDLAVLYALPRVSIAKLRTAMHDAALRGQPLDAIPTIDICDPTRCDPTRCEYVTASPLPTNLVLPESFSNNSAIGQCICSALDGAPALPQRCGSQLLRRYMFPIASDRNTGIHEIATTLAGATLIGQANQICRALEAADLVDPRDPDCWDEENRVMRPGASARSVLFAQTYCPTPDASPDAGDYFLGSHFDGSPDKGAVRVMMADQILSPEETIIEFELHLISTTGEPSRSCSGLLEDQDQDGVLARGLLSLPPGRCYFLTPAWSGLQPCAALVDVEGQLCGLIGRTHAVPYKNQIGTDGPKLRVVPILEARASSLTEPEIISRLHHLELQPSEDSMTCLPHPLSARRSFEQYWESLSCLI